MTLKKKISKVNKILQEDELNKRQPQAFRLLKLKEDQLHQNIALIREMRKAILKQYFEK
jgi:hypothetical protein